MSPIATASHSKKLSEQIDTFTEKYFYQSKVNETQNAENEDEHFKYYADATPHEHPK